MSVTVAKPGLLERGHVTSLAGGELSCILACVPTLNTVFTWRKWLEGQESRHSLFTTIGGSDDLLKISAIR